MTDQAMLSQIRDRPGFIAALDQSGGSTPAALRHYGVADEDYTDEDGMFELMHQMRVRIITAPAFDRARIIAAILFEKTMNSVVQGRCLPTFLWEERGIVPLLKIDRGLEPLSDGVRLMKPIAGLDDLLRLAETRGIFGTKARSVVERASPTGIAAAVVQQLELARRVFEQGMMPIVELEVLIDSPEKASAEALLLEELVRSLGDLPAEQRVILKLTLPDVPNHYADLTKHGRVLRVAALSGGYSRTEACRRLVANRDMTASFSRALTDDLRRSMSKTVFNETLSSSISEIFEASTVKGRTDDDDRAFACQSGRNS